MDEVAVFLASMEICNGLDDTEIAKIAKICKAARFQMGEVIVAEDARGRDLYFIRSGRVRITLTRPSSRHDRGTITKCSPGQVFGELGFIDGARRSTWVVAVDNVEAIRLNWEDFMELVQNDMKIGYQFLYNVALVIAERLRDTTLLCGNLLGVRGSGDIP